MHSNPKSRLLIESISNALAAARDLHGWWMPMPAVSVSYTGHNHVLVHLVPIGVFGPYSRSQIPRAVIEDVAKAVSDMARVKGQTVRRRMVAGHALPAPLSIAQLIAHAAGSGQLNENEDAGEVVEGKRQTC